MNWTPEALASERKFREDRGGEAAACAPNCALEERITVAGISALRCVPEPCLSDVPHVFCHGGGWVFGSSLQSLGLIRRIADQAKRPVISLDYPLAPENPYPAAITSVAAALAELSRATGVAGVIAGSAGAQVALHAMAVDHLPIPGAVMFCGAFGHRIDSWSHAAFGSGGGRLTSDAMQRFLNAYHLPPDAPAADLGNLPPLFLSVGDADPLLSDTIDLYRQIAPRAGWDHLEVVPGVSHGFMNEWSKHSRINRAVQDSLDWLEAQRSRENALTETGI